MCSEFHHTCALGCREEGARQNNEPERVFLLCEEASLRRAGFPCRRDVDCLSPIGATETSQSFANAGAEQLSATDAERLVCGDSGACEAAAAIPPTDMGSACTVETSSQQPGPVVGSSDGCDSGACVVLEGGSSEGTCSSGCSGDGDCPAGYTCADALDNRYGTWGATGHNIAPPRVTACVPSGS